MHFRHTRSDDSRKELRERGNLISKDISQLIDFVKGNPRATCR